MSPIKVFPSSSLVLNHLRYMKEKRTLRSRYANSLNCVFCHNLVKSSQVWAKVGTKEPPAHNYTNPPSHKVQK